MTSRKQPAADRHNNGKRYRAHDQQRHRRGEDHIEVGRHDASHLLLHPRADNRGDQYADNIAARVNTVAEEGRNSGIEARWWLPGCAEDKQRSDDRSC